MELAGKPVNYSAPPMSVIYCKKKKRDARAAELCWVEAGCRAGGTAILGLGKH